MVVTVGPAGRRRQPALQRRRRDPVGTAARRRAQELPARLQGVLRGALVLVVARGAAQRGAARGPGGPLRRRPAVPGRRRAGRRAGRRDLRGPVGADAALQLARRRRRHGAAEPFGLDRPRRQGRLSARAGAAAVGPHDLGLRARELRRPRVHDRRGVRRPPGDRRGRRAARRGRALPARQPAARERRRHGAPARRAHAPHLLRGRRPRPAHGLSPRPTRADPAARAAPAGARASIRIRSCRRIRGPSTSAASRSSRSRRPASRSASSTRASRAWCSDSPADSTRRSRCSSRVRTFELLALPRAGHPGGDDAGPRHDRAAPSAARARLAGALGVELREIDIRAACAQHIADIGLDPKDQSSHHLPEPAGARAHADPDGPREQGGRPGRRHRRSLGAGARLLHLRRRSHRDVQRERRRAEDAGAPAARMGGGSSGLGAERDGARTRCSRRPSRRSSCLLADGRSRCRRPRT